MKSQQVKSWQSETGQCKAEEGPAEQRRAGQGQARQGRAEQGVARQGRARQRGNARHGKPGQGNARRGKSRQRGKAKQGKAKQEKSRHRRKANKARRKRKARQSNTRPARSSSVHLHRCFAKQAAGANVAQIVRQSPGRTEQRRPRQQRLQLGRKESLPRLDMFCTYTCKQTRHLHCISGNTCECFVCPNARDHAL